MSGGAEGFASRAARFGLGLMMDSVRLRGMFRPSERHLSCWNFSFVAKPSLKMSFGLFQLYDYSSNYEMIL